MRDATVSKRRPVLLGVLFAVVVFAMVVLAFVRGLAVDGGSCCIHSRHPQDAADTAALAAAFTRASGKRTWMQAAYTLAAKNGYNNDAVSSRVEVYGCDMAQASCGEYAGSPDHVQAIVTAYKDTFLTNVIGLRQRERAQAIARAQSPAKVGLEHLGGGPERALYFSMPPWLQNATAPYAVSLIIVIGAAILGLIIIGRKRA